jgi:nicotinamidase-related amidase
MGTLVDDFDSVLVVVDAQPGFLGKLPPEDARVLTARIAWLVQVAVRLQVPIVVTEEQAAVQGGTDRAIADELPPGTTRWDKPTFGLAFTPEILDTVTSHGRRTAVLCGLETDVCVAQSAIGLLDLGWRVVVVRDAVGAPGTAHQQGLDRIAAAGVAVLGLKGLYYEWIRRVDRVAPVDDLWRAGPPGITL